jgi:hypothetical protein
MVLCEHAARLANGAPVLVGVFRGIRSDRFPAEIVPFFLAFELEAPPHEAGEHSLVLRLIDEDGQVYFEEGVLVGFEKRPDYLPSYCYFAEQVVLRRPIERPGSYRFDLLAGDRVLIQTRLDIS